MIRAAAKNHQHVHVVVDPGDYPQLLESLGGGGGGATAFRRRLAWKAFQHCATYDSAVAEWLWGQVGGPPPPVDATSAWPTQRTAKRRAAIIRAGPQLRSGGVSSHLG